MSQNTVVITDATFQQEVLESTLPVLVDFWSPTCAPCRRMMPTIESVAQEYDGRVKVAKIDTTDGPETAAQFQVEYIPTVILFRGGQVVDRAQGLQPKSRLVEMLNLVAPA